eukprot:gene26574-32549_t
MPRCAGADRRARCVCGRMRATGVLPQHLPPEPHAATLTPQEAAAAKIRTRIIDLYQRFRPNRADLLPALFKRYQGREHDILARTEQMFAAEIRAVAVANCKQMLTVGAAALAAAGGGG